MKRIKVMLVDDDKEYLSETREMLNAAGYNVASVSDTRKILEKTSRFKPDIILLDLNLGGASGLDVFNKLKELKRTSNIPVIAVTGVYKKQDHHELMKIYGMDDHISKPFEPHELLNKIEKYAQKKLISRELKKIEEISSSLID